MQPFSITATSTHFLNALVGGADEGAWAALDDRYRPVVRGFALRIGLRREDAADVAQQTMLDLLTAIREGRYKRGMGRLRAWIMTIARRRATDLLRGQYRHGDKSPAGNGESMPDESEGRPPDSIWVEEERRTILERALALLADDPGVNQASKRVFELVQVQGVPAPAVAEQCGVSVEQVYVIKHRVLKRLREITASLQEAYDTDE